jgi:F-type H+-transporting ATPase subunit alpha
VPVEKVQQFESELLRFVENSHPGVLQSIREQKTLTDEIKADLTQVLNDFKDRWNEETQIATQVSATVAAQPIAAGAQT